MTSPFTFARNGHRKFIAFVLTASLVVTGFSAAPAKADEDVIKILAGLAFLGIVGAAVNDAKHEREKKRHTYQHPTSVHPHPKPKPMPQHVRNYDLPGGCLTTIRTKGHDRKILPQRCLKRNYGPTQSLPQACYIELSNKHQSRRGYKPGCLRKHGYRLTHR